VLGLPDSATPTQVRAAWRLKAARPGVHPDHDGVVEVFQRLKDAYQRALHIAENAPCDTCRGTGKVGSGNTSFVKTLMLCTACGGSGKRHEAHGG
jgi:DnaJ-class molecular chaperone